MCPFYLMCGMTYYQYWYASPHIVKTYYQKHKLDVERRNEELWLQGLYNFTAVSTALSNMSFDGKHKEMNKYLEKPFEIFPKNKAEKKAEAEQEKKKAIENLATWKKAMEQKYGSNNRST